MVADWIAAGLDPERSTLFVQSLVPEHAELYLLLSMTMPIPWLERVPTYKEQIEQLSEKDLSTLGFLGYPLLQTADIIIYNAHSVPVGEDQVPHLELSREIVRRFHNFYGQLFVEPQPLLTTFPRLPGLDNRKMSKSYGNTINLSDDARDGGEEGPADVHGSEAGPRGHSRDGRRQPGVHVPRRVQSGHGGSRGSEGPVPRRQGRRRRGEDQAREGAERAPRADARAPRRPRRPAGAPARDPARGLEKARGIARRPWNASARP